MQNPFTDQSGCRFSVRATAGVALLLMLVFAVGSGLGLGWPAWLAGAASWVAAILLISSVSTGQRLQIGALFLIGVIALIAAVRLGGNPEWVHLLDANARLLTMIAAVSFLRLVAISPAANQPDLPVGQSAYTRTLLGIAVFGTFINMSAPIMFTDRLAQTGQISRFTSQSITRVFSGCSAWSPFFGGMAVVLTYIPAAQLLFVMAACLPFAVIGFLLVNLEARIRYAEQVRNFHGYPVTFSNLWVPLILVLAVLTGYRFLPGVSILLIIALAAVTVTAVVLIVRDGLLKAGRSLKTHVTVGLPAMAGEVLLFTCAGVLAVGLAAVVGVGGINLPITTFTPGVASVVLASIVLVSMMGIHPVITVAAITPLILPSGPNPQLLAITYLLGWSLGTCSSPLSGTHVVFQGRYGIPAAIGAVRNWPFAIVMTLIGVAILHVAHHFL